MSMDSRQMQRINAVWNALNALADPEIPVITLSEMGIIRAVELITDQSVAVVITPTYSGCPVMEQISDDIQRSVSALGLQVEVRTQLAPAWTTDWMTDSAKEKLQAYGIAPPHRTCGMGSVATQDNSVRFVRKTWGAEQAVECPLCRSSNTVETSHFGSTLCKALYRCRDCQETFDYFKPY